MEEPKTSLTKKIGLGVLVGFVALSLLNNDAGEPVEELIQESTEVQRASAIEAVYPASSQPVKPDPVIQQPVQQQVAPQQPVQQKPTQQSVQQPVYHQPAPQQAAQSCHPSYSGCLKPDASDYDCAGGSGNGPYYTGMVQVIGPDVFDLDRDNDGYGCE